MFILLFIFFILSASFSVQVGDVNWKANKITAHLVVLNWIGEIGCVWENKRRLQIKIIHVKQGTQAARSLPDVMFFLQSFQSVTSHSRVLIQTSNPMTQSATCWQHGFALINNGAIWYAYSAMKGRQCRPNAVIMHTAHFPGYWKMSFAKWVAFKMFFFFPSPFHHSVGRTCVSNQLRRPAWSPGAQQTGWQWRVRDSSVMGSVSETVWDLARGGKGIAWPKLLS